MSEATGPSTGRDGRTRDAVAACAGIAALGVSTFAWLRPINFRGYDEWLIFWMLSRRVVSFPHANRPLGLIWHAPAWLVAPDRLWGFLLVHGFWLTLVGALTCLVVRRLLPGATGFAFLAGALAVVWMPSETTRVATVQMTQYGGCAAGALLATWLFAEGWCRRRPALLAAAAAAAAAAALSHEATLPILAAAPFLLLANVSRSDVRRWLAWTLGWLSFVASLGVRSLLPLFGRREALAYQMDVLGSRRPPSGMLRQLGLQLDLHLRPLATTPVRELAFAAVPVAVVVFALAFAAVVRRRSVAARMAEPGRVALAVAAAAGLIHALLGYLPFVLTRSVRGAVRTEFLSAPGVAVFVAALVLLAVSLAPARMRRALAAAFGAWAVAVGTGRTMALQREWDAGVYAKQRGTLLQLTTLAPRIQTHTLVVLLQDGHAWTFDFSFSKALEYFYADRVRGFVPGADATLLRTRFEAGGVVSEPDAVLRGPWHDEVERYRYDELVVFVEDPQGRLAIADAWPEDLGPLPPAATYAPRSRLRGESVVARRIAILDAVR